MTVATWRLDKTVTIGNLITIALLVAAILYWGGDMEKAVASNTKDIERVEGIQDKNWSVNQKALDDFAKKLDKIDDKLDRLIERR